jgi:hypothetical protein
LLLSRACFRIGSTMQSSNQQTIFTTCQNSQPLSKKQLISPLDKLQKKYIFGLVIKQNNTQRNSAYITENSYARAN